MVHEERDIHAHRARARAQYRLTATTGSKDPETESLGDTRCNRRIAGLCRRGRRIRETARRTPHRGRECPVGRMVDGGR